MSLPDFTRLYPNLADARLGAVALAASDEFFAAKERMLDPRPAIFVPGKYDENGKWMDGWESRRRRGPGHDWCIVRLARPGWLHGVDLDTSHFTGNFPPAAALDGCLLESGDPDANTVWFPLLAGVALSGNSQHLHALDASRLVSHVRVNLYPDGGLARLRLYGQPRAEIGEKDEGLVDLASVLQGGRVLAANNEHFGAAANLLLPGRGITMGDGWETRRRREPGHDWCILELAEAGVLAAIEVDTAHFKGNFPESCSLQGVRAGHGQVQALIAQSMFWPELLPRQPLSADAIHRFEAPIAAHGPISHVRFNIHPDGGVSRLRLYGRRA